MLTSRVLNRTLLKRQHLLRRTSMRPAEMVGHLVGLQAQDTLPPYVGLWSRLEHFDPGELSTMLESREVVRLLLMRGTIHLVSADDALWLRPQMQEMLDRLSTTNQSSRPAAGVPRELLGKACRDALAGGPLPVKALGQALAERVPGYPPAALASCVRELVPLVQVPPRGMWDRSGGVVYEHLETWLGRPLATEPDVREVVRRYLRAFGPARAADLATWSGAAGMKAVIDRMSDELVTDTDEDGRVLYDLPGLPLADADEPAPVRLLGKYDNLWLSHADRTRVTDPEKRRRWMGLNGGVGNVVLVDGMLEGLWRPVDGRVEVELLRDLIRDEEAELEAEVARLEQLLAR